MLYRWRHIKHTSDSPARGGAISERVNVESGRRRALAPGRPLHHPRATRAPPRARRPACDPPAGCHMQTPISRPDLPADDANPTRRAHDWKWQARHKRQLAESWRVGCSRIKPRRTITRTSTRGTVEIGKRHACDSTVGLLEPRGGSYDTTAVKAR